MSSLRRQPESHSMIFNFKLHTTLNTPQHTFSLNAQCQSQAQRLAIIGASGSGKSVLLQLLAGFRQPFSGSLKANSPQFIQIQNHIYADSTRKLWLPPQQRHVGFMFQDYALFPHLTVAQNIAFGLQQNWRNQPRNQPDERTEKWLSRMQLSHIAHHYPHQISGGQKQRTALARACITQPRWLLLDEPFSALDTDLRAHMRQEVLALVQELNIPMLLITHDKQDSEVLAQEIWRMKNGELQRDVQAA
ncbi:ABC transporter ATP-binding protein [Neisseriaceae bacterium B1]